MAKPIAHYVSLLFAFLTLLVPLGLRADDAALTQRVSALEQQVTTLKAENKALRAQNEQLKQKLGLAGKAAPSLSHLPPGISVLPANTNTTAAIGYWLNPASNKRHNASCRYFGNSKGRACGADEGVACKICGG